MGTLTHRRYRTAHPTYAADPNFGSAFSVPDPFALGSNLYVRFGMRVTSLVAATAHQWGQWGTAGVQESWGYSFHAGGLPRLAVYDGVNLVGGPVSTRSFADVLGTLTVPVWLWVACFVELDIGGGNWRFTYWCSRTGFGSLQLMDQITAASALGTFFNSTAELRAAGLVGSSCDRYAEVEVRETPTGPLLVQAGADTNQSAIVGSFSNPAGPNAWVGPDGRTYTLGAFGAINRSDRPRPYAA